MPVDLQALYPRLIHLMLDAVFVVDRDNTIVFVSDACEALLGYQACELIGTPITRYMHPDDLEATRASIVRVMNGQPHFDFRNRYIRKDGAVVHILWAAFWSDEVGARIGVARNVTALTEAEQELRFLAHHDPLTRLSNRSLFNQRLAAALQAAQRQQQPLALLFLMSTASRRSTTCTAMPWATACCARWRGAWKAAWAARALWRGWAATSSPYCSPTATPLPR